MKNEAATARLMRKDETGTWEVFHGGVKIASGMMESRTVEIMENILRPICHSEPFSICHPEKNSGKESFIDAGKGAFNE